MVRHVIVTDNPGFLRRHIPDTKKRIRYFIIEENSVSNQIRNYLSSLPGACECASKDVLDETLFVRKYSRFMNDLNQKHASRLWWTLYFTNKNPLQTDLCKNIHDFLVIRELTRLDNADTLVVVTENRHLALFLRQWYSRFPDINAVISYALIMRVPALFVGVLRAAYDFARFFCRMVLVKCSFKRIRDKKKDFLIVTQFEHSSFPKNGLFRDIYFGRLTDLLAKKDRTAITCGFVINGMWDVLRRCVQLYKKAVYPLEYFLTPYALMCCMKDLIALAIYRCRCVIKEDISIDNEDITVFIKGEIDTAFTNGQVFSVLTVYYSMLGVNSDLRIEKVVYPFENRSWEKMIIYAMRKTEQVKQKLIGYQHASITPKHVNYMLENHEFSFLPMPDMVVSMGSVTDKLLKEVFGFPAEHVRLGCAFRHDYNIVERCGTQKTGGRFTLLFTLGARVDEYVRTLKFLDKASAYLSGDCCIHIRPHPSYPPRVLKTALGIYSPRNTDYQIQSDKGLVDALVSSDVIVYASSTVSIEALALGIPVIYIDFGNFINSDPLFWFSVFKWTCGNPEDLGRVIGEIRGLDKEIFQNRQREAKEYAKECFYPVKSDNIQVFL